MRKELLMISAYILLAFGQVQAQNAANSQDSSTRQNETIRDTIEVVEDEPPLQKQRQNAELEGDRKNDSTYKDNRTDASGGMGALSTTPGVSTTSGAGGLGTNENPGYNTSSDIYNIERKDSIRKANEGRDGKGKRKPKKNVRN
jgi:hypothetical protein